jgi:uncharacterized damage-inducible protein DinB
MLPLFEDFYQRLSDMHDEMKAAIHDLPQEALDWVPGEDMNSLCVLAVHTAAAERYWIGDMVGGEPSGRVRSQEFEARGLPEAELVAHLDRALQHSQQILAQLTLDDLNVMRTSPMHHNREFRAGWSLMHALEHTAVHTGHMQLTRQLWEQR